MLLTSAIKFQKTLALAAAASNPFEAEAAELAARRLMEVYNINPTIIPNSSLYNRMNFADNALLQKLRAEWCEQYLPPPPPVEINKTIPRSAHIPFNIDGFRRHTRNTRKRAIKLTRQDHETIRLLLNQHFSIKDIAAKTGYPGDTINSTRAWHIRSEKWLRINGQFHWADRVQEPKNPQPSEENSEQNAEVLPP